jgi:hypothetical protein
MTFSLTQPKNYRVQKNVAGMNVGRPHGESVQWDKWTQSNSEVDFTSESGNQRRSVNISDYAYISNPYLPNQMLFKMKFQRESSHGYFIRNKIQQCKMAQVLVAQKQFANLQKEYFLFFLKKVPRS